MSLEFAREVIDTEIYALHKLRDLLDERFVAAQDERLQTLPFQMGINACHKSLGGRFLVAGRTVDLPGEIQPPYPLRFQRVEQLRGVEVVILDGIPRCQELGVFQAADGPDHAPLAERDHETADVLLGNLLRFRDVADQTRFFRLVDGEVQQDAEPVASFG